MAGERSRYGLVVSALGAVLLGVSVFLPWYGVSFTASGIAAVQQIGDQVAAQFGNATLQSYVGGFHARLGALAGQQFLALSAHQALKDLNIVLLVLAALALLDALVPLARHASRVPEGAGASLVLLGSVASACVLYRMLVPPMLAGGLVSLSLREGAWLALLGSLMMVGSGVWSRFSSIGRGSPGQLNASAWSGLSGWTPEA
ncbi:MAG: hypothetical protein JWL67_911 [Solirubrobacterales bacterium]|nr:hypothetical protein [Solirubrobacterales bacterium]